MVEYAIAIVARYFSPDHFPSTESEYVYNFIKRFLLFSYINLFESKKKIYNFSLVSLRNIKVANFKPESSKWEKYV